MDNTGSNVVNVGEAKTHLSRLLRRVSAGEEIVIARAGRPIARLVPVAPPRAPRVPGTAKGKIWMDEDFARLPKDVLDSFYEHGP